MTQTPPTPESPRFITPQEAETAFYEAFANADLDAMMAVWSDEEEILCIHPSGTRLNEYAALREGWREIFEQGLRAEIQVTQIAIWSTLTLAVHCVREQFIPEDEELGETSTIVTNVFSRGPNGWRMVMHQVSHNGTEENPMSTLSYSIH